ncbi:MAG: hypothetical protein U0R17_01350 [Acidimicrobiia bacterium]
MNAKAKSADLKALPRLSANNTTPNPGPTYGSACVSRIIVLLDRSYSIINTVGNRSNVVALKGALNNFMTQIGTSASNAGGKAEVLIDAFATTSVWQNGMASGQDFFSWANGLNVADPGNRFFQALNVGVDPSGTDGIWYNNSDTYPYNPFLPATANKGYAASTTLLGSDSYGTTNYHQAFADAGSMIDFWTNPGDRGDDDFDMVLMITDGLPTSNSGSNNSVDPGEPGIQGPWVTPDGADLLYAAYGVNQLRTGKNFSFADPNTVVRPPVPVVGIIAGSEASDPSTPGYMDTVFGSGNWYGANNFGSDLSDRISQATAGLSGCGGGRTTKTDVTPAIDLNVTPTNPTVKEGSSTTITVTVKNPLTDAALKNVEVHGKDLNITGLDLNPGESKTYTVNVSIDFGAPDPSVFQYKAWGVVNINPVTQQCISYGAGWDSSNPCNTPVRNSPVTVDVVRVPLPT